MKKTKLQKAMSYYLDYLNDKSNIYSKEKTWQRSCEAAGLSPETEFPDFLKNKEQKTCNLLDYSIHSTVSQWSEAFTVDTRSIGKKERY